MGGEGRGWCRPMFKSHSWVWNDAIPFQFLWNGWCRTARQIWEFRDWLRREGKIMGLGEEDQKNLIRNEKGEARETARVFWRTEIHYRCSLNYHMNLQGNRWSSKTRCICSDRCLLSRWSSTSSYLIWR